MAVVSTLVTPELRLTPFTGVSEVQREKSGIARAEAVYTSRGSWPATGVGDNRSISFIWDLDPAYGYVLMDCSCIFLLTATNLMNATGFMEIGTDLGPGATQKEAQYYQLISYPARQDGTGSTAVGTIGAQHFNSMYPLVTATGGMAFNMVDRPTALLFPFPGVNSIEISTVFGEQPTNQILQSYRFYARFLQYDIVQGYNYVVNSPIMTRG